MQSQHIRAVRYISEAVAQNIKHESAFALQSLMEKFHVTHGHLMLQALYEAFKQFSDDRRQLRNFMFSGTAANIVSTEHKKLLFLEERTSWKLKVLTRKFIKSYRPNVYLCTVSTALNLRRKKGLWRRIGNSWHIFILDEASMVPAATLMALISRFPNALVTLIGDSKQLPPYVGVQNVPFSVAVSSRSVLDLVANPAWTPISHLRTVYRPHIEVMQLNSELFYSGTLIRGVPVSLLTGSHSNTVEATAAHVLVRLLTVKGIPPTDVMVICLYRDQKLLCERILQETGVVVSTVDSAQGKERSIVILCTTRTQIERTAAASFFSDVKRLNVALSRAKDGMFILGFLPCLRKTAVWANIVGEPIEWAGREAKMPRGIRTRSGVRNGQETVTYTPLSLSLIDTLIFLRLFQVYVHRCREDALFIRA
ncbi:unnamed protein product [Haemonchus placei]|uniref:AAA_12 domain-containing protein n=1 Tax=Haemonchus placei TaxID=6290 RepID=A0A0N4WA16_HAEPC|nr:unnamed protein product [Haemonchus placei]